MLVRPVAPCWVARLPCRAKVCASGNSPCVQPRRQRQCTKFYWVSVVYLASELLSYCLVVNSLNCLERIKPSSCRLQSNVATRKSVIQVSLPTFWCMIGALACGSFATGSDVFVNKSGTIRSTRISVPDELSNESDVTIYHQFEGAIPLRVPNCQFKS
jgi:hypothetical protein